jgi:hypothetical protein
MIFTDPVPFEEALRSRAVKSVLPTQLGSAELQRLSREIRDFAHFSARTSNVTLLERQSNIIEQLLRPARQVKGAEAIADPASARLALKDMLGRIGYDPEEDPNEPRPGSLQDLSSDARIDLIVRTNTEIAKGAGKFAADQDPARLDAWPAQELVRFESRNDKRNWLRRFSEAGNAGGGSGWTISGGSMVALKDDPIWDMLGNPELFEDGLGNPYPPFAFNSGMWTRDISRAEAVDYGLLQPDSPPPAPRPVSFRSGQ